MSLATSARASAAISGGRVLWPWYLRFAHAASEPLKP